MHHNQNTIEASDSICVDFTQVGWNSSVGEALQSVNVPDTGGYELGTACAGHFTLALIGALGFRTHAFSVLWVFATMLGLLPTTPVLAAQSEVSPPPLPRAPHFYSAQSIKKGVTLPPLPMNPFPELKVYPLGGEDYAYDDRKIDYDLLREQAALEKALTTDLLGAAALYGPLDFGPDDLGLEIHDAAEGATGWSAALTIHPPSTPAFPYDLFYTPTLDDPINWRFLMRCTSIEVIARWLCQEQGYFMLTKISGSLGVSTTTTAQQMAESLVPSFVTVANATYTGHVDARGTFSNGNACGLPVNSGVILSSGRIWNAPGPNDDDGRTAATSGFDSLDDTPGDPDLETLIGGGKTLDATVLEFDVVSSIPFPLEFRYVYASEEYPEWIDDFNDPVAIFVDGTAITDNVALVPGLAGTAVAVSTINGGCTDPSIEPRNPDYYVDNHDPAFFAKSPYGTEVAMFNVQYDGITILLKTDTPISANVQVHVKIAVADFAETDDGQDNDRFFDSAILLQALSADQCN
ncbi:MAG: choice-of-anchor L domain-containing protein [Limisphaerales bacterium]